MAKSNNSVFDPWNTFYETPEEQAAIKQRAKMRDAMKAEYRKRYTNPFNPPMGHLHDPALQHHFSAQVTYAEYLRPSPKLGLIALGVLGVGCLAMVIKGMLKKRRFQEYNCGELTYRERWGGNTWL
ncbi:unnamed protein product [Schistosoma mattheei]|uniref:NADH dehydrogenase [ubiquinone] 1 beta subcomplex subunit 4 n=1 Tax=Schistosoma mattheei TaxID=31246 RepID=A0AA85AWK6_9TREM|nr:unnamed protein product [Schistosoma mattheei]